MYGFIKCVLASILLVSMIEERFKKEKDVARRTLFQNLTLLPDANIAVVDAWKLSAP